MASENIQSLSDCEIVCLRIVNAPIETVFSAWAEPNHLKNWWGPKGFTNTFEEFDLRPGGRWRFVMHGPEKGNYRNDCEFTEIIEPTLISWKRHSKPHFRVLVTFEKISSDQTRVIFKQIFDSADECNKIKPFVEDKNEENLDKLEIELKIMLS